MRKRQTPDVSIQLTNIGKVPETDFVGVEGKSMLFIVNSKLRDFNFAWRGIGSLNLVQHMMREDPLLQLKSSLWLDALDILTSLMLLIFSHP